MALIGKMFLTQGKVLSNREIKPKYFSIEIKSPSISKNAKAGQFVTIRCGEATAPLLRRPFSFHRINGSSFEVLYEVLGRGTNILASKKPGEKIDILGPLGNGFSASKSNSKSILVAGGIGVAPLLALAQALVKSKKNQIHAIIGARDRKRLLCSEDFNELGIKPIIATDDGSYGKKGFASDVLDEMLKKVGADLPTIFACGPEPMLREIAHIVRKRGMECYASLEENIACGVGACLGCAVKTKSGYKLVCKDGPVFNLNEIIW